MGHTKYQPNDEEWKCPKCGAGVEYFTIYDSVDCVDDVDCCKLHNDDAVFCDKCDYSVSGRDLAKILKNKSNRSECPHCKGTGWIDKIRM
ncbi:MAG: hypothetical protein ACTSRU_04785 [Candidatus Hodarchaeales archaeon]